MTDSLREALEEAYTETAEEEKEAPVEETTDEPAAEDAGEPEETRGSDKDTEEPVGSTEAEAQEDGTEAEADEADASVLEPDEPVSERRAPESWKPAIREHWGKIPQAAQEEITRRESEIANTLSQTAGMRKFAEAFQQTIRPYEHILRMENANPLQAVDELFKTSAILRQGTQAEKANMVATMVKKFSVSIEDLDNALVGESIPDEDSKLQKLLAEQLKPVNEFMAKIGQHRTEQAETQYTQIDQELLDFEKKEFYGDVRETMADIMEIHGKRGQKVSLQEAYDQAVQMSPEIGAILKQRRADQRKQKRAASASLPAKSASGGTAGGNNDSIRNSIENAINIASGR